MHLRKRGCFFFVSLPFNSRMNGQNMEIGVFSKCIKELIVENDRVDVPYLGTFTAEMMPASYSDRQTTIHPPYRKMSFHKGGVSLQEGQLLLEKVRRELGVSLDQAGVELGWCLSRLSSELEGRKRCTLPGLGMMRANARNEFFFVPDDDLDIWPDGIGFDPIAIKMPKEEMPGRAGHDEKTAGHDEEKVVCDEVKVVPDEEEVVQDEVKVVQEKEPVVEEPRVEEPVGEARVKKPLHWGWIVSIVLAALLLLFIVACYLFTDQMSPILDPLLYSKEELELLRGR